MLDMQIIILVCSFFIGALTCFLRMRNNTKKGVYCDTSDQFSNSIFSGIAGVVLCFLIFLLISYALPKHLGESHRIKIHSLRDNISLEGSFTLGSGSIGTVEYYTFYRDWSNGLKKDKVPVAQSVIFEDNRTDAELIVMNIFYDESWLTQFAFKSDKNDTAVYHLHVPKGVVVKTFKLE